MDSKTEKKPQDSSRINVNEDYELRYWTKKFGVSAERLKAIVKTVGMSVTAVEKYLKSNENNG
jgi:hypothetical protein